MNVNDKVNDFVLKFRNHIDASEKFHDDSKKHFEESKKLFEHSMKLQEDSEKLRADSAKLLEHLNQLKNELMPVRAENNVQAVKLFQSQPESFPQPKSGIIETFSSGDDLIPYDLLTDDFPQAVPKPATVPLASNSNVCDFDLLSSPIPPAAVDDEPLEDIVTFPHCLFPLGEYLDATLLYIYSIRNFYVVFDLQKYISMSREMTSYYGKIKHFSAAPNVNKKQLYVLKAHPVYLRVQVINYDDPEKVSLLCVDSGEQRVASIGNIIELDANYSTKMYPVMAINCCHVDKWEYDITLFWAFFCGFINEKSTQLKVKFFEFLPEFNRYTVTVKLVSKLTDNKLTRLFEVPVSEEEVTPYNLSCVKKEAFEFKSMYPRFSKAENDIFSDNFSYTNSADAFKVLNKVYPVHEVLKTNKYSADFTHFGDVNNIILIVNQKRQDDLCTPDQLTTNISSFYRYSEIRPLVNIKQHMFVVFRVETFYLRGFLLHQSPMSTSGGHRSYLILSVDYGFMVSMPKSSIFPIHEDFTLDYIRQFSFYAGIAYVVPKDKAVCGTLSKILSVNQNKIDVKKFDHQTGQVLFDVKQDDETYLSQRLIGFQLCSPVPQKTI